MQYNVIAGTGGGDFQMRTLKHAYLNTGAAGAGGGGGGGGTDALAATVSPATTSADAAIIRRSDAPEYLKLSVLLGHHTAGWAESIARGVATTQWGAEGDATDDSAGGSSGLGSEAGGEADSDADSDATETGGLSFESMQLLHEEEDDEYDVFPQQEDLEDEDAEATGLQHHGWRRQAVRRVIVIERPDATLATGVAFGVDFTGREHGIFVHAVEAGGLADKEGVAPGLMVTMINGQRLTT